MAKYKVLTGLTYGNRSVAAGDIVDDIPAKSIKWLREQGLIESADGKAVVEPEIEPEEPVSADPSDAEEEL